MSIQEDLKAYLDGELDPVRREEVKVALERDPALREELSQLQVVSESILRHSAQVVPHGSEKTLEALRKNAKPSFRFDSRWVWGSGLAIAAVIVAVAVLPKNSSMTGSADTAGTGAESAKSSSASIKQDVIRHKVAAPTIVAVGEKPKAPIPLKSVDARPSRELLSGVPANSVHAKAIAGAARNDTPRSSTGTVTPSAAAPAKTRANQLSPPNFPVASVALSSEQAGPTLSIVTLAFASPDSGEKLVKEKMSQYVVTKIAQADTAKSTFPPGSRTVEVDLPEEDADKLIAEIQKLPASVGAPPELAFGPRAGQLNGFSGGGGRTRAGAIAADPAGSAGGLGARAGAARGKSTAADANVDRAIRVQTKATRADAQKDKIQARSSSGELQKALKPVPGPEGQQAIKLQNAARDFNSVEVAQKRMKSDKPKLRRVIILITEKPKPDPVP